MSWVDVRTLIYNLFLHQSNVMSVILLTPRCFRFERIPRVLSDLLYLQEVRVRTHLQARM